MAKTAQGVASATTPYPSWPSVAELVAAPATATSEPECRTLRDARIWQSLADEPLPSDQARPNARDAAERHRR